MPDNRAFVDTNILFYAHDKTDPEKYEKASRLIGTLWQAPDRPWLSVQVLQELFVNLSRAIPAAEAEEVTSDYMRWNVVENDVSLLREAFSERRTFQVSFWDALILAAAGHAGARVLYSEDFGHERKYGTVRVVNPFL